MHRGCQGMLSGRRERGEERRTRSQPKQGGQACWAEGVASETDSVAEMVTEKTIWKQT